jgi:hypothetical protein
MVGTSKGVEEKRAKQSRSVSAWLGVPTGAKSSSTVTSKDSIQCGLTKVYMLYVFGFLISSSYFLLAECMYLRMHIEIRFCCPMPCCKSVFLTKHHHRH